jgi:hypothetical protein
MPSGVPVGTDQNLLMFKSPSTNDEGYMQFNKINSVKLFTYKSVKIDASNSYKLRGTLNITYCHGYNYINNYNYYVVQNAFTKDYYLKVYGDISVGDTIQVKVPPELLEHNVTVARLTDTFVITHVNDNSIELRGTEGEYLLCNKLYVSEIESFGDYPECLTGIVSELHRVYAVEKKVACISKVNVSCAFKKLTEQVNCCLQQVNEAGKLAQTSNTNCCLA